MNRRLTLDVKNVTIGNFEVLHFLNNVQFLIALCSMTLKNVELLFGSLQNGLIGPSDFGTFRGHFYPEI